MGFEILKFIQYLWDLKISSQLRSTQHEPAGDWSVKCITYTFHGTETYGSDSSSDDEDFIVRAPTPRISMNGRTHAHLLILLSYYLLTNPDFASPQKYRLRITAGIYETVNWTPTTHQLRASWYFHNGVDNGILRESSVLVK